MEGAVNAVNKYNQVRIVYGGLLENSNYTTVPDVKFVQINLLLFSYTPCINSGKEADNICMIAPTHKAMSCVRNPVVLPMKY
jgi:hypothetical protein